MANPNCEACGRFLNCDEGMSHFTPDSEHTVELMEWYCRDCSEREQIRLVSRRRQEIHVIR